MYSVHWMILIEENQMNCFEVKINELIDSNQTHLNTQQYLFDTSEFIFN